MARLLGVVVCVDYDDLLAITLPRAMRTLSECYVITSPEDERTQKICSEIPNVHVFETDAFTRDGAIFNKGRAIEECLVAKVKQHDGWVLIFDADIVIPQACVSDEFLSEKDINTLYGCYRRMLTKGVGDYPDHESLWMQLQRANDVEFAGFFQLFHTRAASLCDKLFWYDPTFTHAGGGDAYFQSLFASKQRLEIDVLHIGERDRNWFGRVTNRVDGRSVDKQQAMERQTLMSKLRRFQGWMAGFRPSLKDRVRIPGVISNYVWGKSHPPKSEE